MTTILGRYVIGFVLNAILMTLLLILSLDFLASLIDQSEDLSEIYTFGDALLIALLELPREIHEYLPATMLIGSLIGLGILSSSNEVTVMRGSGISKLQIFRIACIPVLFLAFIDLLVIEFVSPAASSKLIQTEYRTKGWDREKQTRNSLWNREGKNFIYIQQFRTDSSIQGLTLFRFNDEHQLDSFLHAKTANFNGDSWDLADVEIIQLRDDQSLRSNHANYQWQSQLNPRLIRVQTEEPQHLSSTDVWLNMQYRESQDLDTAAYAHTFWNRMFQPLACCALLLVGISSLFGPMREATMGYRVFIGVLIGYSFNVAQEMLAQLTLAYQFPPLLIASAPIILVSGIGLYLLKKN